MGKVQVVCDAEGGAANQGERNPMQLPGMATDLVRVSLDVTWDPVSGDFGFSRRIWSRPHRSSDWQLEDMACSGSPVSRTALPDRWAAATRETLRVFTAQVEALEDPFPASQRSLDL